MTTESIYGALSLSALILQAGFRPGWLVPAMVAVGVVAVVGAIIIFMLQKRQTHAELGIEIQNLGNVPSHFELRADTPEPGLKFDFGLDGHRLPQQTHLDVSPTAPVTGAPGAAPPAWAQTPALRPGEMMKLELLVSPARSLPRGHHSLAVHSRVVEAPTSTLLVQESSVAIRGTSRLARTLPSLAMVVAGALVILVLWAMGNAAALVR